MKKLLAMLLALFLLWGAASAGSGEEGYILLYESSFAGETDGWYTIGAEDEVYATKQKTLGIRGRTEDWNSPRRDFSLEEGEKYRIEAEVLQKDEGSASFILSVAHDEAGGTVYRNIVFTDATKKKWTKVSCEWTPWFSGTCTLYVETNGNPNLEYEIRKFRVSKAPDEADSMVLDYRKNYAKILDKVAAELKKLPFPELIRAAGTDPAAWIPAVERSETAELLGTTVEGRTISVSTDREVTNLSWLELTAGEGFYVGEDLTMFSDSSSYTMNNPGNRITLRVREAEVAGRKDYDDTKTYLFNPETGSMELTETSELFTIPCGDLPPYDTIRKAQAWINVVSRSDGSLSQLIWDLVGGDVKYSLQAKAFIGEDGRAEQFFFIRRGDLGNRRLDAEFTTDGDLRPVSLYWSARNGDNSLRAEVYKPDPSDPNIYYMPAILEKYTREQLEEPGAVMWAYDLDFGEGCTIQYFLTKDDILAFDENGSLQINAEARDVNGKPFQAAGISPLIDPGLYILP